MPSKLGSRSRRGNTATRWAATKRVAEDDDDVDDEHRVSPLMSGRNHRNSKRNFADELHQNIRLSKHSRPKRQSLVDKPAPISDVVPKQATPAAAVATRRFFQQDPFPYPRLQSLASQELLLQTRGHISQSISVDSAAKDTGKAPKCRPGYRDGIALPLELQVPFPNDVETQDVCSGPTDRKPGQLDIHGGRLGRWQCFGNAPYSSSEDWIFIANSTASSRPDVTRSQVPKQRRKKRITFLSLPGELRNEVYKYVIPECRVLVTRTRPNKELDRQKDIWSQEGVVAKRMPSRLTHMIDTQQGEQSLAVATNMPLVSKQVRAEVEPYFYSRTTFCFSSLKNIDRFLLGASKSGIKAIRRIEIFDRGYANPELTEHQQYRDRYYEGWSSICTRIGEGFNGLEQVKLEAHISDWPCNLTVRQPESSWRRACLQLAPRRLPKVEVTLHHSMIYQNAMALRDLARNLENDMMTQEGQNDRDRTESLQVYAELAAKTAAKAARAKAKRIKLVELSISREEAESQTWTPTKVLKHGLEKYSQLDVSAMCPAELWQHLKHNTHMQN